MFHAPGVRAQAPYYVSLGYEMDPTLSDCPAEAEFKRDVTRQLGYDPFRADATRQVVARTAPTSSGMTGALVWRDAEGRAQGERRLVTDHRDCRELVRSMAFAVVVQLQLLDEQAEPKPEPEPETQAEAPEPPQPEVAPVEDRPRVRIRVRQQRQASLKPADGRWQMNLGLGPAVAVGLAPNPSALARVFAAARYGDLSLELGAAASWPATWRSDDGSGFESNAVLASVAPCLHRGWFSACPVAHLGSLSVEGVGIDEPRASSGLLIQTGLRLAGSQPLGPIIATLRLEAMVSLRRWSVEVNEQDIWRMPGATFHAGLDFALPLSGNAERQP